MLKNRADGPSKGGLLEKENIEDSIKSSFRQDTLFQQDKYGRQIVYPYGALGNGYALLDTSKKEEIRNFMVLYSGISFVVISIGILIGQEKPIIGLLVYLFILVSFLWYRVAIRKLLLGLEVIEIGSESYSPPTIDKRYRGLGLTFIVCGVIGGIGNIYNKGFSISDFTLAAGCTIIFVLYSYVAWFRK